MDTPKLFIFDTHPIQYRSPVFRALARRLPGLFVYYFDGQFDGSKWWFHEVGKIPKQPWNMPLQEGFPNHVLESRKLGFRKSASTLHRLLKAQKPQAVVIYGWYLPEHWVLWALCKWHRIPLIFIGETFSRGGSWVRRLIKGVLHPVFFAGVEKFVSIGKRTYAFYRSFKIDAVRIFQAKYCVDVSFFTLDRESSQKTRQMVRDRLNIPQDAFVNIFVGRLFERKRPEDVITIHQALRHHKKLYTIVVGNGPLEESLRNLARNEDRILFTGFQDQSQTRDLYHASDLFVLPSEYETWGLVVNEAAATGLPAVVSDTCGVAGDLVKNERTGFVFPVRKPLVAARWISDLIDDPRKRFLLGLNAQMQVNKDYGVNQFADAILGAFKATAKSSAR